MIKIKDIEEYIDDTMLETIFRKKEKELYNDNQMTNEEIAEIT